MYVKILSLVLIYNISCNKIKLFRLHRRSRTNNELIYESNRVLQITTPFKDKVFRLAKRLLISKEEAEDATQEVLSKLWSKMIASSIWAV
jgi:RNA polymerase sigma-70 factor (ECF subfamily)